MIDNFPSPTPSRGQTQDVFDAAMGAFLAQFPTFVTQANLLAQAMNLNSTTDTSASSLAIGTGSKTFTVSADKSFQPGMYIVAADSAAPSTNSMLCQITSYSGTTLIVDCKTFRGSGTIASWVISQSAAATDVSADINSAAGKNPPIGADKIGIWDSVSNALKGVTFTNLASYFAGLCSASWNAATATNIAGTASEKSPDIDVIESAGSLTVALNQALYQDFRSATLSDGSPSTVLCDPVDFVIPGTATLGAPSGVAADIAALILSIGGGVTEFAALNLAGGVNLDESGVISTTAIGATSDSSSVVYSATARTNVPYKIVKRFRAVNTTDSWASPGFVADIDVGMMSSIGHGQSWQDVSGSRVAGTTYYNTTGKPIQLWVYSASMSVVINGLTIFSATNWWGSFIIPVGASYSVTTGFSSWKELR